MKIWKYVKENPINSQKNNDITPKAETSLNDGLVEENSENEEKQNLDQKEEKSKQEESSQNGETSSNEEMSQSDSSDPIEQSRFEETSKKEQSSKETSELNDFDTKEDETPNQENSTNEEEQYHQTESMGQSNQPTQFEATFDSSLSTSSPQESNQSSEPEVPESLENNKTSSSIPKREETSTNIPTEEDYLEESSVDDNSPSEYNKEQLEKLRDKLNEYSEKKKELESSTKDDTSYAKDKIDLHPESKESKTSEEESYELSKQSNEFLNQLSELPAFENRNRGPGYSIDTKSKSEIPESVVRTLITKFLNQRFCQRNSDLNVRSNSLEKSSGFYKWEVKDVIVHSKTHQLNKVLNDKYSYEYAEGHGENVPLSFYFDMSGSMTAYSNMLATIAIELLKKNVKVLIGFNERVNVQIDSIAKNISVEELSKILTSAGYSSWGYSNRNSFIKDSRVKFKYIDRNIDNYLIERKAEKCVVFTDFDPFDEVINLSQSVQTYWFCFNNSIDCYGLKNFNGFLYQVQNAEDILLGLVKVNENRFETLCYVDNPKQVQKRRSKK